MFYTNSLVSKLTPGKINSLITKGSISVPIYATPTQINENKLTE